MAPGEGAEQPPAVMKRGWWRVYYDDGTAKEADVSGWHQLPDSGVLFVLELWRRTPSSGPNLFRGRDYYLLRDHTLMAFDGESLHDHLRLGIEKGAIKFGRWAPDETWRRAQERVESDIDRDFNGD